MKEVDYMLELTSHNKESMSADQSRVPNPKRGQSTLNALYGQSKQRRKHGFSAMSLVWA